MHCIQEVLNGGSYAEIYFASFTLHFTLLHSTMKHTNNESAPLNPTTLLNQYLFKQYLTVLQLYSIIIYTYKYAKKS